MMSCTRGGEGHVAERYDSYNRLGEWLSDKGGIRKCEICLSRHLWMVPYNAGSAFIMHSLLHPMYLAWPWKNQTRSNSTMKLAHGPRIRAIQTNNP